ncbi:MAG: hypothetical protein P8020_20950 [Acidobacteriota bacterium]|jgi:hypothetical protein
MRQWKVVWVVALALFWIGPLAAQRSDIGKATDEALEKLVRLPPSAFPALPKEVAGQLERRGCLIPQASFYDPEPHNVISGEFARRGQTDWAVLCSVEGQSKILVFWGGPARCPDSLPHGEDRGCFQDVMGDGTMAYSCVIFRADEKYIKDKLALYGQSDAAPVIDHDGINDAFAEKASSVRYCHDGRWLDLPGAD